MKISLRWHPKTTQLFLSNTWDEMARLENRWETVLALNSVWSLGGFFCRWCVKVRVESRYRKQGNVKRGYLKKRGLRLPQFNAPMVGYDEWGKQEEGSCQSRCAGVGKALTGLNAGLSHSVPAVAAILRLHTTCLWGFNHRRQTARGFTGRKHSFYRTETHRGNMQYCTWQRERLLMLQFIIS